MDNLTKMFDCPEIQDGWVPKVGDWTNEGLVYDFELDDKELGHRKPYGAYIVSNLNPKGARECGTFYYFKDLIFKPSIEQLMGMVKPIKNRKHRLYRFHEFVFRLNYKPITKHKAYIYFLNLLDKEEIEKELWLAFVIHELHNKKWTGERWE